MSFMSKMGPNLKKFVKQKQSQDASASHSAPAPEAAGAAPGDGMVAKPDAPMKKYGSLTQRLKKGAIS